MSVILDLPLNEEEYSKTAYDYSGNGYDAKAVNIRFRPGHYGYAAHFKGNGYLKTKIVSSPVLDLTLPEFTIAFWHKPTGEDPFTPPTHLIFAFAFADNSIESFQAPITLNKWDHWAIIRDGNIATVYKNTFPAGTIDLSSGNPVEYAVHQHDANQNPFPITFPITFTSNVSPYATGLIDEFIIYDYKLSSEELSNLYNIGSNSVKYSVDWVPFSDYDVGVNDSLGVLDELEMKQPSVVDWANEHGEVVDLYRPRYKAREIQLQCFIPATDYLQFTLKVEDFLRNFNRPLRYNKQLLDFIKQSKNDCIPSTTHRLRIGIDDRKPLVYEVYIKDLISINKKWNAEYMVGSFNLKLVCPYPVSRVLRYIKKPSVPIPVFPSPTPPPQNPYGGNPNAPLNPFPPITFPPITPAPSSSQNPYGGNPQVPPGGFNTPTLGIPTPISLNPNTNNPQVPPGTVPTIGGTNPMPLFPIDYDVYVSFICNTPLNIFWGDGTASMDVLGENGAVVKHKYPDSGGVFDVIVTGNIEDIHEFTTNAIVVWNKL